MRSACPHQHALLAAVIACVKAFAREGYPRALLVPRGKTKMLGLGVVGTIIVIVVVFWILRRV